MNKFKPKTILISGAAGFIGSHVSTLLCEKYPEYTIVCLDKLDYCSALRNLDRIKYLSNFRFVKGDILTIDLLTHVLSTYNIDTVIHFAAQTHVDNSFGNSLTFTMNNTYGTHVLLEACRKWGHIKRFVNVSTDEVYGETSIGKLHGLIESSHLDPTNPYSAAKAGAEMLCKAYITSYGMPIIVTRGNNVYGPHQFPEKMIPKFTILASRGDKLPLHGTGGAMRSYLYVQDVAEAFDCILHKGAVGETYNIGTSEERSVMHVAEDICKYFGLSPEEKIEYVKDRPFNDMRYYIGSDKLEELGWRQRTTWEEGLKLTIDWYCNIYCKTGGTQYWCGDVETALGGGQAQRS